MLLKLDLIRLGDVGPGVCQLGWKHDLNPFFGLARASEILAAGKGNSMYLRQHSIEVSKVHSILKRAIDIVAAALGILLLVPSLAIVAVAIKLDSPGPVFFRQTRVGRGGGTFRIFKFRTMCVGAEQLGAKLTVSDDPRVTRVGRFLRRSKIDELPQLINVLIGEMSLVGPRPESPEYMNFYSAEQRARILRLRPGVTDFASILLRDESSLFPPCQDPVDIYRRQIIPLKWRCYDRYFREMGVLTDLRIILATLALLFVGRSPAWLGIEFDNKHGLWPQESAMSPYRNRLTEET
jgi:lipopolysaccharide/colanic/teichoic acid biosynthesis glycosyltransferase